MHISKQCRLSKHLISSHCSPKFTTPHLSLKLAYLFTFRDSARKGSGEKLCENASAMNFARSTFNDGIMFMFAAMCVCVCNCMLITSCKIGNNLKTINNKAGNV